MKKRLRCATTILVALALQGCGVTDSLETISDGNDPEKLLEGCFAGNKRGQCTTLEAIYGIDPRADTFCKRAARHLTNCDTLRDKAKATAGI